MGNLLNKITIISAITMNNGCNCGTFDIPETNQRKLLMQTAPNNSPTEVDLSPLLRLITFPKRFGLSDTKLWDHIMGRNFVVWQSKIRYNQCLSMLEEPSHNKFLTKLAVRKAIIEDNETAHRLFTQFLNGCSVSVRDHIFYHLMNNRELFELYLRDLVVFFIGIVEGYSDSIHLPETSEILWHRIMQEFGTNPVILGIFSEKRIGPEAVYTKIVEKIDAQRLMFVNKSSTELVRDYLDILGLTMTSTATWDDIVKAGVAFEGQSDVVKLKIIREAMLQFVLECSESDFNCILCQIQRKPLFSSYSKLPYLAMAFQQRLERTTKRIKIMICKK